MAILANDILQYFEYGRQQSQTQMNVYFYRVDSVTVDFPYQLLLEALVNDLWTMSRRALTTPSWQLDGVEIRNLSNEIDFLTMAVGEVGTNSNTDTLPTNTTVTVRLQRSTLVTRNGYKRYSGIPEALQNNSLLDLAGLAAWQNHADNLAQIQEYTDGGDEITIQPVIVGVNDLGQRDLTKINPIQSGVVNAYVGSQNTRKVKSGF